VKGRSVLSKEEGWRARQQLRIVKKLYLIAKRLEYAVVTSQRTTLSSVPPLRERGLSSKPKRGTTGATHKKATANPLVRNWRKAEYRGGGEKPYYYLLFSKEGRNVREGRERKILLGVTGQRRRLAKVKRCMKKKGLCSGWREEKDIVVPQREKGSPPWAKRNRVFVPSRE